MDTIELNDRMKLILTALKGSVEAAKQEVALREKAINEYALECAEKLKVDIKTHVLDTSIMAFFPRPEPEKVEKPGV